MSSFNWAAIPSEIKLDVLDYLHIDDVRAVAYATKDSYDLAMPVLFRTVKLKSMEAFQSFLISVPREYHAHIRELEICTRSAIDDPYGPASGFYDFDYDFEPLAPIDSDTDASEGCYASGLGSCPSVTVTDQLVEFLKPCVNLRKLALNIGGSPSNDIIPVFETFTQLRKLAISNWADEDRLPISERLIVTLAYSLPSLRDLSLSRITRSAQHAHELLNTSPFIPIVLGDDAVPAHPILGTELRLPALIHLPKLRVLRIRDTHLGDPLWCLDVWREQFGTRPRDDGDEFAEEWNGREEGLADCAPLETLDLGSSPYESATFNQQCTERILFGVPQTIRSFALSTALDANATPPSMPCAAPMGSTNVMGLGNYKFPCSTSSSSPSSSISPSQSKPSPISPSSSYYPTEIAPHHRPLPHLTKLHLGSTIPPSRIPSTLSQPQLASSPVHTLSCLFHPDDAAEGCDALANFLQQRRRSSLGLESVTADDSTEANSPVLVHERVTGTRSRATTSVSSTSPYISASSSRQSTIRAARRQSTTPSPTFPDLRRLSICFSSTDDTEDYISTTSAPPTPPSVPLSLPDLVPSRSFSSSSSSSSSSSVLSSPSLPSPTPSAYGPLLAALDSLHFSSMYTPNTPAALQSARERHEAALRLKALGAEYGLIVDITGVGIETKNPMAGGFVEYPHADDGDDVLLQYSSEAGIAQKAGGVPNRLRSMTTRI